MPYPAINRPEISNFRQVHPIRNPLPLLRLSIQIPLRLRPNPPYQLRLPSRPRRDLRPKRFRHRHKPLRQPLRIRKHRLPIRIRSGREIKPPEQPRNTQEQAPFGNMHALTDATTCAERELISLRRVRVSGGVGEIQEIVSVAVWVESTWLRVAGRVHVDGVDVAEDAGAGGDAIAHVAVVFDEGVREAEDGGGHPAQGLFDAAADVLHVWLVGHGWEAVGADDAVDLCLCFLLHVGEEDHGLDEGVECAGGCVGAGFKQAAGDVGGLFVAEAVLLLQSS